MTDRPKQMKPPSEPAMRSFLERLLPGNTRSTLELREGVLDFCASPIARTVLLEGQIGSGKSTLARGIAALKRVAPLKADDAADALKSLRFVAPGLIDLRSVPWYVELALTGLSEDLVDVQLFGAEKGSFTGSTTRPGLFERAMRGGRKIGEKIAEGVELTGGVVFLDEVGDLLASHQAKLLPVLSNGAFYRIGAEGGNDDALEFKGVLITATWRDLSDGRLRPDLLSRIAANKLYVPPLSERMDDFDAILATVERESQQRMLKAIEHVIRVDPSSDKDYWEIRRKQMPLLSAQQRHALSKVDWARYGNLRGLTCVVDLLFERNLDVAEAVQRLPRIELTANCAGSSLGTLTLQALLTREPSDDQGLASHLGAIEQEARVALRDVLKKDRPTQDRIADRLKIPRDKMSAQVAQLCRSRGRYA